MIPPCQRLELLEPGHRTALPPPGADAFLQRGVIQLALRSEQPHQRIGLPRRRLQHRLKGTKHNTIMNNACDTRSGPRTEQPHQHDSAINGAARTRAAGMSGAEPVSER